MMTLSRRWVRCAVCAVFLIVGSFSTQAQEVLGTISGTVVDPAGAGVSGATVSLTKVEWAHSERSVKTDKTGFYTATSLPLGNYTVSIAMKGFKTTVVTGLVLHANDELKVGQKLVAGGADEKVSVVLSSPTPNLGNGMSESLVTGNQVRELVLSTRNYEQLLTLQPGVSYGGVNDQLYIGASSPTGVSNQVLFSVNGLRPTANNWTVDGADNVNRGGNPALPGGEGNLTLLTYPSVDGIAEFVTLRGDYSAEYGRNMGAQINVVTKSGTNSFHGSGYEFFRNDVMNANNYFNNLTSTARPELRYNDFGFTVGGPVILPHLYKRGNYYNGKSKTFFFYSEEFRRVVNHSTITSLVPTAAERVGNFSNAYVAGASGATAPAAVCSTPALGTGACTAYTTQLTQSQISPTAQAYINGIYSHVPVPNSAADLAAGLDPHTLSTNVRNVFHDNQYLARLDHAMGSKVNLFYRYLHDDLPSSEGAGLFVGAGMPGIQRTATNSGGTQHAGHITIAMRPTMLLDMGYAYSANAVVSIPVGSTATSLNSLLAPANVAPVLPYTSTLGIVPSIAFSNGSSASLNNPVAIANANGGAVPTGISNAGNYAAYDRNHSGFGSLTKIVQQHTFKFGIAYNHYQKIENATGIASPYPQGLFTFGNQTAPTAAAPFPAGAVTPSNFDSTFASFLVGNAANGTANGFQQSSVDPTANLNENLVELYAQDNWRATRRLTVNLGVRYSYFGQPFDDNSELSNFDPALYKTANAETIDSNGQLCTTASETTVAITGTTPTYTTGTCLNANGLNSYAPNGIADPLNGIILGRPIPVAAFNAPGAAPSAFTHGSPFGLEVGHAEKRDFAPRVGFALDVFGNGKTALRGGYGISYDDSAVSIYEQAIFNNVPYVNVARYPAALLDRPGGSSPVSNLNPPTLYATPITYQTPYAQQFSIGLQQVILPTLMLDIGYVGDHGTHLQGRLDINEAPPGAFAAAGISNNGSGFRAINLGPLNATNGLSSTGNLACTNASPSSCFLNVFNAPANCAGFVSAVCENPLNQIRPYTGYGPINAVQTIFNSNYNSLQVKLTKKFSGKSFIDANYTFSKALTNAPSDSGAAPQNTYNLEPEYGRSPYDRNNILTVDAVWELPWMRSQQGIMGHVLGGWELSGIYTAQSGLPLTATMTGGGVVDYGGRTSIYNSALTNGGVASDAAGLGILGTSSATLRPNQVLNPNSGYGQTLHRRIGWFNPTAFVAPSAASYQVGNERRGVIQGPGFNRLDVGIFRNFKLYHEANFQLRGEAYNAANQTNKAGVCTSATDTGCGPYTFGQVTSARDPRMLQVGGKITF